MPRFSRLVVTLLSCVALGPASATVGASGTPPLAVEIDALLPEHEGDLTAALIAAVEELHPTGGTIYFSGLGVGPHRGRYEMRTHAPIRRAPSEHTIEITTRNGEFAEVRKGPGAGLMLAFRHAHNLRIANLRLTGRRGMGGGGLVISDCSQVSIENVRLRDADGHGIAISDSRQVRFHRVRINRTRAHGIRIANCNDVTLEDSSIDRAGAYGVGVQSGEQLTRDLRISNTSITRSSGDGIDIKGQREDGDPLVVLEGLRLAHNGKSKSAALDLRGHVSVRDVSIRLNPGSTGLRFRMGTDIGTHSKTNGWAGYGTAEDVRIDSDAAQGTGIVVQSGKVTLKECSVSGPVQDKVHIYEWANREHPVVLQGLSLGEETVSNRGQYLAAGGSISKNPEVRFE